MHRKVLNRKDIVDGLKSLGLSCGDTVLLHSSLSSMGFVDGGADTVINALLEAIGEEGTLCVPNLPVLWSNEPHEEYLKHQPIFDVRVTPSKVGVISETLRKRGDAKRSLHPSHSLAAAGKNRDWLVEGHEFCTGPCGMKSPYWKNCKIGGKIILLGVTQASNTTLHTIEELGKAPMLSTAIYYPLVIDYSNRLITVPTYAHLRRKRDFSKMDVVCEEAKIMNKSKIGEAEVRLIDARKLLEIGIQLLKEDPYFLFKQ